MASFLTSRESVLLKQKILFYFWFHHMVVRHDFLSRQYHCQLFYLFSTFQTKPNIVAPMMNQPNRWSVFYFLSCSIICCVHFIMCHIVGNLLKIEISCVLPPWQLPVGSIDIFFLSFLLGWNFIDSLAQKVVVFRLNIFVPISSLRLLMWSKCFIYMYCD